MFSSIKIHSNFTEVNVWKLTITSKTQKQKPQKYSLYQVHTWCTWRCTKYKSPLVFTAYINCPHKILRNEFIEQSYIHLVICTFIYSNHCRNGLIFPKVSMYIMGNIFKNMWKCWFWKKIKKTYSPFAKINLHQHVFAFS